MKSGKKSRSGHLLAQNRVARRDYMIVEHLEAGIVLEGWEVKSAKAGQARLTGSYVVVRDDQLWLLGSHLTPLASASTHVPPEPQRNRKLLLKKPQLRKIGREVRLKGATCICLDLHLKGPWIKATIALAKGKKQHEKRAAERERDINREIHREFGKIARR